MRFQKGNQHGKGRIKGSSNILGKDSKQASYKSLYNDLIGSFTSGKYYVYYHICLKTNKVVYIGKGKDDRAWNFNDKSRNNHWLNYKNENKLKVKIIASMLSNEEAIAIEKILISIKKPILNILNIK